MTTTYGPADMLADWCNEGREVCDTATTCIGCDGTLCRDHSVDFVECADDPNVLHHPDCRQHCDECKAAAAYDHATGEA